MSRQTNRLEMPATDSTSTRASAESTSPAWTSSDARLNELLLNVEVLYDRGRYSDAFSAAAELGPLQSWRSAKGRVLAGRLAMVLGAPRLGRALHWLAAREFPDCPRAAYYAAIAYWNRCGAFHAWRRYGTIELPELAGDDDRADWFALKAQLLATLRDFERAEALMIAAMELRPASPWLHVELSEILNKQDMPEEALKAAREALALQPCFRPAVQVAAQRMVDLGQDDQAVALLTQSASQLQSGEVWCQLAALERELHQYAQARQSLLEAERCWPLARHDRQLASWFAGQRCDVACLQGRYAEALELAKTIDRAFYKRLIPRLEKAISQELSHNCSSLACAPRVQLPVPFVRQAFNTCVPATLSAIAGYWSRPVAQTEVAARICYGGTRSSEDRQWAEEHGLYVREFTITEENVEQLIRASIPFAVCTVDPGSAHMQVMVGIDCVRGTYLLQDPRSRHTVEWPCDQFHRQYDSDGPTGMVLLPPEKIDALPSADGQTIELADAPLYDFQYALERSLSRHDRASAASALAQLASAAPDHRLTWQCRLTLALYDGDEQEQLQVVNRLLEQFPGDVNCLLMKYSLLGEFGSHEQRLELLRTAVATSDDASVFQTYLAAELFSDARHHIEAVRCLKRALRIRPHDVVALSLFGEYFDNHGRLSDALECYRLAACFNDTDERLAFQYFAAAEPVHQTATVLAWLRDRCQRLGDRSSQPFRTLAHALSRLDNRNEARELLKQALSRHPEDGELLATMALSMARANEPSQAVEYLNAAAGRCSPAYFTRMQALVSEFQGDPRETRERYLQTLQHDPLNYEFLERVLTLDCQLDGEEQAAERLRAYAQQYPHSFSIRTFAMKWSREHGTADAHIQAEQCVALHPGNAWVRREAALAALNGGDLSQAEREIRISLELDPNSDSSHAILGDLLNRQGRMKEAGDAWRQSLTINIQNETALEGLVQSCDTALASRDQAPRDQASRDLLRFVRDELQRQSAADSREAEYAFALACAAMGRLIARSSTASICVELLREPLADDMWFTVVEWCLYKLPEFHTTTDVLDAILSEFTPRLRERTETWSAVATALCSYQAWQRCVDWTKDWDDHHDARSKSLVAAIVARWNTFASEDARPIMNHALSLEPDDGTPLVQVLAILDCVLIGDHQAAQQYAQAMDAARLIRWYLVVYNYLLTALEKLAQLSTAPLMAGGNETKAAVHALASYKFPEDAAEQADAMLRWIKLRVAASVAQAGGLKLRSTWLRLKAHWIEWNN